MITFVKIVFKKINNMPLHTVDLILTNFINFRFARDFRILVEYGILLDANLLSLMAC